MLVLGDHERIALLGWQRDGHDLLGQSPCGVVGRGALLAALRFAAACRRGHVTGKGPAPDPASWPDGPDGAVTWPSGPPVSILPLLPRQRTAILG